MKIYTNNNYEIISIDKEPSIYAHIFDVEQLKGDMFGNWCDACIQGYKYEPQYEFLFNEDGSNAWDEKNRELLYKLDGDGNKIPAGYSCYPFVDINTLMLIQKQHEDFQKQIQVFGAQVAYMSMMSGIEMEVGHE